jgi:hypothetical protein
MLTFKVAAKYARGPEQLVAQFGNEDEAKEYISSKLEKDIALRVSVAYLLYDMGELVGSFDQNDVAQSDSSGQQQASTQRFSPSPLATAPRPTSVPASSFVNVKDDDKKKE